MRGTGGRYRRVDRPAAAHPGGPAPVEDAYSVVTVDTERPQQPRRREDRVVVVGDDLADVIHASGGHGAGEIGGSSQLTGDRIGRVGHHPAS